MWQIRRPEETPAERMTNWSRNHNVLIEMLAAVSNHGTEWSWRRHPQRPLNNQTHTHTHTHKTNNYILNSINIQSYLNMGYWATKLDRIISLSCEKFGNSCKMNKWHCWHPDWSSTCKNVWKLQRFYDGRSLYYIHCVSKNVTTFSCYITLTCIVDLDDF